MFPVFVTVNTPEQLKALYDSGILGDAPAAAGTQTAGKGKTKAADKAPAALTAAAPATTAAAPAAAAPTTPVLSDEGKKFIAERLAGPVQELSMKDEPKMKAICAEYGVERVSLIPEKLFPEVLQKVQDALDPGAAERKRLEAIDRSRSLI